MAVSEEYLAYITEMLEGVGTIQSKCMFGGVLFTVDGNQLGVVLYEELYFKVVDVTLQQRFRDEGSEQFSYTRKDKKEPVVIKNWWKVPERYLDDPVAIQSLAEEILRQ
tara:strand:+ start:564 stop:890 length:327 start_codon:yes stop_codon:yes gene_type:complete